MNREGKPPKRRETQREGEGMRETMGRDKNEEEGGNERRMDVV
jgi:hypothetical protein